VEGVLGLDEEGWGEGEGGGEEELKIFEASSRCASSAAVSLTIPIIPIPPEAVTAVASGGPANPAMGALTITGLDVQG
ncbi:hypothetical protein CHU98_g12151, partial [Xylaria longipes]